MSGGDDSWFHEKESAWLYLHVAAKETDPVRSQMFARLAAAAEHQAGKWADSHPGPALQFTPTLRARIVARLVRLIGPVRMRPVLVAMKLRGMSIYSSPATPRTTAPGHVMPTSVSQVGERHRSVSGGNLRAAVFGANDGLVSNASLILGVAAAGAPSETVLLTGVAGLLAGALSMASGEYVSVRSQREMYEYQIALEKEELLEYPGEEAEELALIYNARGLPIEEARKLAQTLLADPELALDTLAREELGLNPDDLGSPLGAAVSSFLSFAVGAVLPLAPFLVGLRDSPAIIATVAIAIVSLAGVGLAISLFTGRGAWRGAARMVLIGGGAGIASWLLGKLLGVAMG